jgi:hypothetical protein
MVIRSIWNPVLHLKGVRTVEQLTSILTQAGPFGLAAVPIIYWLTQHARRVGLISTPKVAFLVPGVVWSVLVTLAVFYPMAATVVLVILGGWAATILFKAGAKDNERNTNQGASQ